MASVLHKLHNGYNGRAIALTLNNKLNKTMEAHQERVVEEKQNLDDKLDKLRQFVASSRFDVVPSSEQARLQKQLKVMGDYSQVLQERIDFFMDI